MRRGVIWLFAGLGACAGAAPVPTTTHVGPVTSLAFGPRGVASCSQGGVFVGDRPATETRLPLRPVALAVLASGELLVAGGLPGRRGEVALVQPGRVVSERLADDLLYAIAVHPDGRQVATGGADGRVRVLALPGFAPIASQQSHSGPCRAVAFTADGKTIVSAGLDGVVVLRELANGAFQRLTDHTAGVDCLAISADGTRIASGARDGKVRIHARDGRQLRTFARLGDAVLALAWQDDKTLLAGLGDGHLLALEDEGDGPRRIVQGFDGPVHAVAARRGGGIAVGLDGRMVALD